MRRSRPAIALTTAGPSCRTGKAILLGSLLTLLLVPQAMAAKPSKPQGSNNQGEVNVFTPINLEYERYFFRYPEGDNSCLGEDDEFGWKAVGELKPGESYSFTPQYPGCQYHHAAVSVVLSWQGGELELSSEVPANDYSSWDTEQRGKMVVAPNLEHQAQLCMFPAYELPDAFYTITVTNVGNTTASGIVLEGRSENDWAINYYPRCLNGDADNDGWNDSLEHTMANMLYPRNYVDGVFQPYILWGSNYLSDTSLTMSQNDEVDSIPVDLNDDGMVDTLDIDIIQRHLGEGNGVPLEALSPNSGNAGYVWGNVFTWRRYDLDGDGYVGLEDLNIVSELEGEPLPMMSDLIAPTARVVFPAEGEVITRGRAVQIKGHAWDNVAIARVEYLVDGKVICDATDPVPRLGVISPFFQCSWNVPKRRSEYDLSVRVTDAAGQITTSPVVRTLAQ